MRKIIILFVVLALVGIAVVRFWTPEDIWLCQNGAWIKHGNPAQSQPTTVCAKKDNNNPVACTMEAKLCSDGSAVGRTGPNCEFASCPLEPKPTVTKCTSEQRGGSICTAIYKPVCAKVNIQCFTTPCNPIYETFSNACQACQNSLVESYTTNSCHVK